MAEKTIDIEELKQDSHNLNKGTELGAELMERSFKTLGAGRSVLIDKDNNLIAGNKSQKAAIKAGIKTVRVIETTGDELIAVKRTDLSLDSPEGRQLAFADNLTTQVNLAWDEVELDHLHTEVEGFDTSDWGFDASQLAGLEPVVPKDEPTETEDEEGIEMNSEGYEGSTTNIYLVIGKTKIPMSEGDLNEFKKIADKYLEENGVLIGLPRVLIERYKAND